MRFVIDIPAVHASLRDKFHVKQRQPDCTTALVSQRRFALVQIEAGEWCKWIESPVVFERLRRFQWSSMSERLTPWRPRPSEVSLQGLRRLAS